MKYQVIIEPPAQTDMEAAYCWIAADSPTHAAQWYNRLLEAIDTLEHLPERCGLAPESEAFEEEIRQLLYGKYRVLFTMTRDAVHVLHVRHGARQALAPEGGTEENEAFEEG